MGNHEISPAPFVYTSQMKVTSRDISRYFCRKCNHYILYNEACELIYNKVYPQYAKTYYNKDALKKQEGSKPSSDVGEEKSLKARDNLFRQIYANGMCGVNKQKNDFAKKDNLYNMLHLLNRGDIKCSKCGQLNMWGKQNEKMPNWQCEILASADTKTWKAFFGDKPYKKKKKKKKKKFMHR
ncbi:conserved Plasmodium protein, unknown function [Plasmodium ovale wallikeri]|uniref:Uncharacterized protein n=1 Tax=Plasmodium ovale wallikeri TaxID=864142 RepID=A0A1A8YUF1_PLAOA|nr:conserved Plasmodium protein, unknown function [Plasmodium ovale wallikeri]